MSFIKETENYLKEVLNNCGYDIDEVVLESSSRRDLGEFQINCAMSLAKKYGKNPRDIFYLNFQILQKFFHFLFYS